MKRIAFLSGTGLVSLHLIDVALVDVEPGASLARHIPWLLVTLAVAAAAALSYRRLPRGTRAAAAGTFGVLALAQGLKALYELPGTAHTQGLQAHPATYTSRVVGFFDRALAAR